MWPQSLDPLTQSVAYSSAECTHVGPGFCHKGRHDPVFDPDALGQQLVQYSIVRHPSSFRVSERGLVYSWTSLGVFKYAVMSDPVSASILVEPKRHGTLELTMSLYFDPESFSGIEKLQEVVLVHCGSQHGISVHYITQSPTVSRTRREVKGWRTSSSTYFQGSMRSD